MIHKYILGWDPDTRQPLLRVIDGQPWKGGLLGVTEAFEFAVEEQGRLALHVHLLVWTGGHSDFIDRLEREQLAAHSGRVTIPLSKVVNMMDNKHSVPGMRHVRSATR